MKKEVKEDLIKILAFALLALLIFLSYKILQPFFIILITAFVLAYLTRPLFVKLNKKLPKGLSTLISLILVLLIILIPISFVTVNIINEAKTHITPENIDSLTNLAIKNQEFLSENLGIDFSEFVQQTSLFIAGFITDSLSKIPSFLFLLFILSFSYFYFLYDWDNTVNWLKSVMPFKNKKEKFDEISETARNIVRGSLVLALIEAAIGFVGFYLLDINLAFVLSFLLFFLAFIPSIGPGLIWVPLAIYFALIGDYVSLGGILVLGIILSYGIDTIFRSKWIGEKAKMHPLIMLLGILGGISVFGVFGFIIGPLVLLYTIKYFEELLLD